MVDKMKNNAILGGIGCGSPVSQAAVAPVIGGDFPNTTFAVSLYIEPVGRTLCGATCDASSTPAGSFLYPMWKSGKEPYKNLITRRWLYARIGFFSHFREKSCRGLETVHDRSTPYRFAEKHQTSPSKNYCCRNSACLSDMLPGENYCPSGLRGGVQ